MCCKPFEHTLHHIDSEIMRFRCGQKKFESNIVVIVNLYEAIEPENKILLLF